MRATRMHVFPCATTALARLRTRGHRHLRFCPNRSLSSTCPVPLYLFIQELARSNDVRSRTKKHAKTTMQNTPPPPNSKHACRSRGVNRSRRVGGRRRQRQRRCSGNSSLARTPECLSPRRHVEGAAGSGWLISALSPSGSRPEARRSEGGSAVDATPLDAG